ncbi:unnamed protein product [Mesocestoides corti]|uniref:GLOBIN domain-containing protein n=1 Tax=Mesocestoides corti TaxID=53468 RepID=A0A0R3UNC6_MESCO|nr:unnamed protein product [Mesocestoides corti]
MGCEFSGHHMSSYSGSSRPYTPQGTPSSSTCDSSSAKLAGGATLQGTVERRGSLLLPSRRTLTRQRTIEQVVHAAVVKRQPLHEYFSEFEKDVLISTWKALLLYTNEHGALIFRLAAEMCPELKAAYNVEFDRDDEIVFSSYALQYSRAYVSLIDDAILSLEDPQEGFYDSVLIAGASQAAIPHMKPDYFKVFKRATLTTWEGLLGEEFTGDVKSAWQTLLDYVVAVMAEGSRVFVEEERRSTLNASEDDKVDEHCCVNHRLDFAAPTTRKQ